MSAKVPRERLIGTIDFKRDGFNELLQGQGGGLPSEIYDRLILRLRGTWAKESDPAPTLVAEQPFTLLKSIQTRFGSDAWNDVSGTDLRVLSHLIHDRRGKDAPNTVPVTNDPDTDDDFSTDLYFPFRFDDMVAPRAGAFPANRYKNSGLRIVFGNESDLGALVNETVNDIEGCKVDVIARVWTGQDEFEKAKFKLYSRTSQVVEFNGVAATDKVVNIPNAPAQTRGILIKTFTDSPETPLTTLVDDDFSITLRYNNSDRKYEYTFGLLKSLNEAAYGAPLPDGYFYIDLADDGDFARLQDMTTGLYDIIIGKTNAVANAKMRFVFERYMQSL